MKLKSGCLILLLSLLLLSSRGDLMAQSNIWVGSWSCAPYAAGSGNTPPDPYLANNTLRQVIRVSIGGDTLRMKFSNKTSSTPVSMKKVTIAVSTGGSSIDVSTIRELNFDGHAEVTMDAHSSVLSDELAFPLSSSMRLAITIFYGEAGSSQDVTSHVASRTDSYIVTGDQTSAADFSGATVTAHWFHINTIDVMAPDTAGCVGVLGNSITDGYGLSGGLQNRWTDFFSQELLDDGRTEKVGVLNLGIGATAVAGSGATTGVSRFQDDILSQSGLRWVIIFYGVNDIGWGRSAATVIDAYKDLIYRAQSLNIKVYGATITPFKGHSYYTEAHDAVRNEVNEWIRTEGNFDAFIDFDEFIRDPDDTTRMRAEYSNDGLHPSVVGYEFMGKRVDLNLFTEIENTALISANAGKDKTLLDIGNDGNQSIQLDGSTSFTFGNNISAYIWSEDGNEIANGERPMVDLAVGIHHITLTVSDAEGNTDNDEVVITILEDSGIWLEAECGSAGSLWNMGEDQATSNGYYMTVKPGNTSGSSAAGDEGRLTYTFDVSEAGTYTLYARVICPNADDDSFWLKMDNGSFAMWNNIGPSTSWFWEAFTSGYSLTAGSHTLTISYREDGAKLDKIWLTKNRAEIQGTGSDAVNCFTDPLLADAGTDAEYCNMDGMVQLGGNPSALGGAGPYTYSWNCLSPDLSSFGKSVADILDNTGAANPIISDLFEINDTLLLELAVQDRFSEGTKDTVCVVVSSLLVKGSDNNEFAIAGGESIEISPVNIVNGIAPLSYLWTPASGLSDPAMETQELQPDSSITYEVLVTDALGCKTTDQFFLTVNPNALSSWSVFASEASYVYPNPVNEFSSIYLTIDNVVSPGIKILNAAGQILFDDRFEERVYPLGNIELPPGVYYYMAIDRDQLIAFGKFTSI